MSRPDMNPTTAPEVGVWFGSNVIAVVTDAPWIAFLTALLVFGRPWSEELCRRFWVWRDRRRKGNK